MGTEDLSREIMKRLAVEYIDIANVELDETRGPHDLFQEWNMWQAADDAKRTEMVREWLERQFINLSDMGTLEERFVHVREFIKQNRRNRLYNNIDFLKRFLESYVHEEDVYLFRELIDTETDIEVVRAEIKGMLRRAYDAEVEQGMDPDPLEYYDVIGDVRED